MIWTIKLSSRAEKHFLKLDKSTRERIKKGILELQDSNDPLEHQNVKPLTGELRGFFRLRTGKYRIIFSVLKGPRIIAVVNKTPRGDAYK